MGLPRAMVDLARVVYEVEDPDRPWIEGEPEAQDRVSGWFKCRITLQQPREQTVSRAAGSAVTSRGYRFLEGDAELMMLRRFQPVDGQPGLPMDDGAGNFTAFDDGMQIQVISSAAGDRRWYVNTGVQPFRRRKTVLGWHCGLRVSREPIVREEHFTAMRPSRLGVGGVRVSDAVAAAARELGGEPG